VEKEKHILVYFDSIIGEEEVDRVIVVSGKGKEEDIVHAYFKEFWGDETVTANPAMRYERQDGAVGVKIRGWTVLTPKEVKVLKRLLYM